MDDAGGLPDTGRIRQALLRFFDREHRDLPWRRDRDPYRVWISEVMLQQTRVETVVPYYERWLERFPTVDALADADEQDVLDQWTGLGYYARARNLHSAARQVRERHGGRVPGDAATLRGLPGIGEYTSGAIASIAFGAAEPAVDANARRVLSRVYDLENPTAGELRRRAEELVPRGRPGDFNQAVMELGSTVCTPRSPDCASCPIAGECLSRARGTQELRPVPRARREIPEYDVGTAIIRAGTGRVLLVRRPMKGLLGGMWEFPGALCEPGESPREAAARVAARLIDVFRGDASAGADPAEAVPGDMSPDVAPVARLEHAFSHRRHTYHAFRFTAGEEVVPRLTGGKAGSTVGGTDGRLPSWIDHEWVPLQDDAGRAHSADLRNGLGGRPLPAAQRRIAERITGAPER